MNLNHDIIIESSFQEYAPLHLERPVFQERSQYNINKYLFLSRLK